MLKLLKLHIVIFGNNIVDKNDLIAFERTVAEAFLNKQISAPVHLCGGNEDQLIEIFKEVRPNDWVFSTWRSTYHALLKGVPPQWVFSEMLAGRSMLLMNAEYRLVSSAIVGGILPIACGVALGAKLRGLSDRIWVFVGDMTATTGLFREFEQYCAGHELPVRIVVEDNGVSTNTPTDVTWGTSKQILPIQRYRYQRTWPHVGIGQHVAF